MKALEWFQIGKSSNNPFDAFSNYWRGFNNLFAGQGQERSLIADFLRSEIEEEFANYLLEEHAKEAKELILTPVIDMRRNGKDTAQYIENFELAQSSIEKLVALFMIIYQVRCNFEHGQKSPSRVRDKALCESACPFVAGVLLHTT